MRRFQDRSSRPAWFFALLVAITVLSACSSQPPATLSEGSAASNLPATAAAEATAIIQAARATAMVLEAQSQAAAILSEAESQSKASDQAETTPFVNQETITPAATLVLTNQAQPALTGTPAPKEMVEVEIVSVGYAADGGFIIVNYRASQEVSDKFWPGVLSVIDEATGNVYNEVPVMPKIGPLISRPPSAAQVGNVMFVNGPAPLPPGSLVTVILANYKQEHILVK